MHLRWFFLSYPLEAILNVNEHSRAVWLRSLACPQFRIIALR